MASTVIRGAQIKDSTVQRHDLDTSTVGQAVVTKLVQGSGVTLSSTGADSGTGDVTVSTSAIPLASSSTSGLMNQTSGNTTDFIDGTNNSQALQPVIWSVTRRVFQAIGNPTFEVDQRNVGIGVALSAAGFVQSMIMDRYVAQKNGASINISVGQSSASATDIKLPGTNFRITSKFLSVYLNTAQASLAAGDYIRIGHTVEGPAFRELSLDVHSISLIVLCTSALKFSVAVQDNNNTHGLCKLCTITTPNVWTLISLPNLPLWTASGNFSIAPGTVGYYIYVTLACGSTGVAAAEGTWQNANVFAAPGADNFAALAAGAQFYLGFLQHEPGAQCTTLQDCSFTHNYDECLRYFQKTYQYGTKPGSANVYPGACSTGWVPGGNSPAGFVAFKKPMAKIPTITGYSPQTGAANNVTDTGTDRAISSTIDIGDAGFAGFTVSTTNSGFTWMRFHYTADTGW